MQKVVDTLKNYIKHCPANTDLTWKRVIRRHVRMESKKRFGELLECVFPLAQLLRIEMNFQDVCLCSRMCSIPDGDFSRQA